MSSTSHSILRVCSTLLINEVIISARSIGNANVQMILEPLGGGGNTATAGAQLKDCDVREALDRLLKSIENYYEN